jgi:putative NADPH-quinone reductase
MKQVLIINADINKTAITEALINAYRNGASAAVVKQLAIADLIFNPNKQFINRITELEPHLTEAVGMIRWASHIVVFCPVYKDSINTKIKGFFDRIFFPDQVFNVGNNLNNNFSGKSARIISILDEAAWNDWLQNEKSTYLSIKKNVLEKCFIKPVRTSTIGHLYSIENDYSKKWLSKLYNFGLKLI